MISTGSLLVLTGQGLDPAKKAGPGKQVMGLGSAGPRVDEIVSADQGTFGVGIGLRTKHGNLLWCSLDQRVGTVGEGERIQWKVASEVRIGDRLICFDGVDFPSEVVARIATMWKDVAMVDVKTKRGRFFAEGILCRT